MECSLRSHYCLRLQLDIGVKPPRRLADARSAIAQLPPGRGGVREIAVPHGSARRTAFGSAGSPPHLQRAIAGAKLRASRDVVAGAVDSSQESGREISSLVRQRGSHGLVAVYRFASPPQYARGIRESLSEIAQARRLPDRPANGAKTADSFLCAQQVLGTVLTPGLEPPCSGLLAPSVGRAREGLSETYGSANRVRRESVQPPSPFRGRSGAVCGRRYGEYGNILSSL